MKIFYDGYIFQTQRYGGISRYFYELITRFLKFEDVDVEMFMGVYKNKFGLENFKHEFTHFWGLNTPCVRQIGLLKRFIQRTGLNSFLSAMPKDPNRIQHSTYYPFYEIGKSKKIFTVYDFTHEKFSPLFQGDSTTTRLKRMAFLNADALICISETTKKDLLELYGDVLKPHCKIEVIYLGYSDLSKISSTNIPLPSKPFFLYVGDRGGYKNFDKMLEAYTIDFSLKENFSIVCVGKDFSSRERKLINACGVSHNVHVFSGGDNVLATLYKNAVAFVYPSLYEGFGLPPLEAMSCGCPVIASNTSSIPEVVGSAALLFDPTSVDDMRNALCKVASDNTLRKKLTMDGMDRCKAFSWEKTAEQTKDFYAACLKL